VRVPSEIGTRAEMCVAEERRRHLCHSIATINDAPDIRGFDGRDEVCITNTGRSESDQPLRPHNRCNERCHGGTQAVTGDDELFWIEVSAFEPCPIFGSSARVAGCETGMNVPTGLAPIYNICLKIMCDIGNVIGLATA